MKTKTAKPGDPNPDGYGEVYALAKDGTAFVLDRAECYDRFRTPHSSIIWKVAIKHPDDRHFEWNETYDRRRDAVAAIHAAIAKAQGQEVA